MVCANIERIHMFFFVLHLESKRIIAKVPKDTHKKRTGAHTHTSAVYTSYTHTHNWERMIEKWVYLHVFAVCVYHRENIYALRSCLHSFIWICTYRAIKL